MRCQAEIYPFQPEDISVPLKDLIHSDSWRDYFSNNSFTSFASDIFLMKNSKLEIISPENFC